jgi:hypothetical protein
MNTDRLGMWLSVLTNIGVLAGLILVIVEVRHSSMATTAAIYQENINYGRDHIELLLSDENKELAALVFRGESDPDSLSEVEQKKFVLFIAYRMAVWETVFVNHDDGLIDDRHWYNWDAWYSELLSQPGYTLWWEAARHGYDPIFQQHVDQVFKTK